MNFPTHALANIGSGQRASLTVIRHVTTQITLAASLCFGLAYLWKPPQELLLPMAALVVALSLASLALSLFHLAPTGFGGATAAATERPDTNAATTAAAASRVRRYQRIVPHVTQTVLVVNKKVRAAEIVDLSPTGVALRFEGSLSVGQSVQIGKRTAAVVRLLPGGAAFEFHTYLDVHSFDKTIVL